MMSVFKYCHAICHVVDLFVNGCQLLTRTLTLLYGDCFDGSLEIAGHENDGPICQA